MGLGGRLSRGLRSAGLGFNHARMDGIEALRIGAMVAHLDGKVGQVRRKD